MEVVGEDGEGEDADAAEGGEFAEEAEEGGCFVGIEDEAFVDDAGEGVDEGGVGVAWRWQEAR